VLFVAGLYRLAQTEYVQDLIKVSKLLTTQEPVASKEPEPPPEPEKHPEPESRPEPLPEPPPEVKAPQPQVVLEQPDAVKPAETVERERSDGKAADPAPFAIGKGGGRFSGYEAFLTASIQAVYQQPPDLPDVNYAVLCELVLDEEGYVLEYKLVNSSGSEAFDRSTVVALSRLRQVRPPPDGMSRTVLVKFFPP